MVTALLGHGLRIDRWRSTTGQVHQRFPWLVETGAGPLDRPAWFPQVPLSFTVVASRAG